jgi:hypothetical protein
MSINMYTNFQIIFLFIFLQSNNVFYNKQLKITLFWTQTFFYSTFFQHDTIRVTT